MSFKIRAWLGAAMAMLIAIGHAGNLNAGVMTESELQANGFVQWEVATGGNGHWYKLETDNPLAFWAAQDFASNVYGGYLITITSAAEESFRQTLVDPLASPFLGGFQNTASPSYSEPGGGWEWVTGEVWDYTNWHLSGPAPPEPNEGTSGENFLTQHGNPIPYTWNDARDGARAFMVEVDSVASDSQTVPEPTSLAVFGLLGLTGIATRRRRR